MARTLVLTGGVAAFAVEGEETLGLDEVESGGGAPREQRGHLRLRHGALMGGRRAFAGASFVVLVASASYIVVPAVVRYAIPEARPSRYFTMSLAVTFPFNVLVGIPIYHGVVKRLWGA